MLAYDYHPRRMTTKCEKWRSCAIRGTPVGRVSNIGERLKAIRHKAGLSQEQFAGALGYSKRALFSWELNATEPPIAILSKIRELYDVDPEWVIMGDGLTPPSHYGPVDWERLDRIAFDIDAVCVDVGLNLNQERRTALARVQYDADADGGPANKKQLRGMLLTLSQGG